MCSTACETFNPERYRYRNDSFNALRTSAGKPFLSRPTELRPTTRSGFPADFMNGGMSLGTRLGLAGVERTLFHAIQHFVAIAVDVGHIATALTGVIFFGIVRAQINAVGHPVAIAVDVGHIATTLTGVIFFGIVRAQINAVGHSVAIAVHVGHTTSALTGVGLGGVIRAEVEAVGHPVTVAITIAHAAAALPR